VSGGGRRYTQAELDDACRDMVALVREFSRNPDPENLTREMLAVLDNGDLRAIALTCLGAVHGMLLQLAGIARQVAEAAGDHDLAARIEQDPGAYIDSVLSAMQAGGLAGQAGGG
jgi:hypothetical protein